MSRSFELGVLADSAFGRATGYGLLDGRLVVVG